MKGAWRPIERPRASASGDRVMVSAGATPPTDWLLSPESARELALELMEAAERAGSRPPPRPARRPPKGRAR